MGKKNRRSHLFGAVSEDGRRFKILEKPLLDNYASDTHTVVQFELANASVETGFEVAPAIPGHTFEDNAPVSGDMLKHAVRWRRDSDFSAWSVRPIRLRIPVRSARLHAFQFVV